MKAGIVGIEPPPPLDVRGEFETADEWEERIAAHGEAFEDWEILVDAAYDEVLRALMDESHLELTVHAELGQYDPDLETFSGLTAVVPLGHIWNVSLGGPLTQPFQYPPETYLHNRLEPKIERLEVPIDEAEGWRERDASLRAVVRLEVDFPGGHSFDPYSLMTIIPEELIFYFCDSGEIVASKSSE